MKVWIYGPEWDRSREPCWYSRCLGWFCKTPAPNQLQQNSDLGNFWRVLRCDVHIFIYLVGQHNEDEWEVESSYCCSIREHYNPWYSGVAWLERLSHSSVMVNSYQSFPEMPGFGFMWARIESYTIQCAGCRQRSALMQESPLSSV